MENFMLWGIISESGSFSLSFFATRIQLQNIHLGTRKMIDKMLTDLGLPGIEYNDWSVLHFRNNYFASANEKVSNPDAWNDTWEISLKLVQPLPPDIVLPVDDQKIYRTYARDDTWDGTHTSSEAPYIMVARFYSLKLFTRAFTLFSEICEPRGLKDSDLHDLVEAIKQHPVSSNISAKQRSAMSMELLLELGTFDESSFSETGCLLVEKLTELIYELGATITWDEKADYLLKEQRHSPSPE